MRGAGNSVLVAGDSPLTDAATERIVKTVLRGEGRTGIISVTYVGRDAMRRLHKRVKGVSRAADVLAYSLTGPNGLVVGDIYVCSWVARREARRRRIAFREEVTRYVIHGVLHVLGHEHPADESREESRMWRRQEKYVKACR